MGEPIKAEKVAKHFATVTSPGMAAVPFGKRAVPTVPAVNFSNAVMTAVKTYGNSAPLFLLTSKAIDPSGKVFVPLEAIWTNKVEISFATAHGHTGTLTLPNGVTLPAAINTGVLSGPEADCGAEIEALLYALADRAANEFKNDPLGFLNNFNSAADAAVLKTLGDQAKGIGDWLSGAWDWTKQAAVDSYHYVADGGAAQDLGRAADYVASGEILGDIADGAVAAYEWTAEAIDTLRNLDYEQLKEAFVDWLRETIGELKCDARDALAAMLADPRPMSVQMGEMYGTAKVAVAEAAAAVAVDVLVSKGAASAATRMGALIAKAGPRLAKLGDKIGDLLKRARRKPNTPDRTPDAPKPTPKPDADKPKPKPDDKDKVRKDADGKSNIPCVKCPTTIKPVNTIFGCKLLDGEEDLDFVIRAPLPLVWQRTYTSNNPHESCLGQGWSLPLDFRIDVEDEALTFVDAQGRRTRFPLVAVGGEFFSPYEHTTLRRPERNRCELVTPEKLRLVFGLSPRDWAHVGERDRQESEQDAQFDRVLAQLRASGELAAGPIDTGTDHRPPQATRLVLLGVIDPNGHWLRIHYAAEDRPQVIETSNGRYVGLQFDTDRSPTQTARLLRVTELAGTPDAHGRFAASRVLVAYRYSEAGDLVAVVDESGAIVRTFAWANHMLVEHGEPGGIVSRYEWDQLTPQGRVVVNTHSSGERFHFAYDPLARENRVTDASGRVTRYRYDENRYYTGLVTPDGAETQFLRDAYGSLQAVIDPLGRTTRYSHDSRGNLTAVTRADGSTTRMRYGEDHRKPLAIVDPLGQSTEFRYDARGNLVEMRDTAGATTCYTLDASGRVVSMLDARGGQSFLDYDAAGRLAEYRDCLGQPTRYAYDEAGNVVQITDAIGAVTRFAYQRINRQDRLVAVTHPDGAVERLAYDTLGRLIARADPAGNATRYHLSPDGKPVVRENALGHSLRYHYDVHGRLLALTNENGAIHRFAWDAADRLVSERGFDGRRIDYRYNAAGELLETADGVPGAAPWMAPGQAGVLRTRYQRDMLGRLTDKLSAKSDGERPQIRHSRYLYNINGQLVQARNAHARVELHYSATGQVAREITHTRGGLTTALEHAYDGLGNRYQTVLPDGRVLRHSLYGSGHVDRITLDDALVASFERDALQRETVRRQGALQTFFEHDTLGRLTRQLTRKTDASAPAAEPRIQRHYHYDRLGRLLQVEDARHGNTLYHYDAIGRLLAALGRGGGERFAFDPANNLLDPATGTAGDDAAAAKREWTDTDWRAYVEAHIREAGFNPLQATRSAADDPERWDDAKPNRLAVYQQHRYRYDTWGNCVEKRSGAHEIRRFRWDAEHQLEQAEITRVERGTVVNECWGYDYDPFGRRIAKYSLTPTDAANAGAGPAVTATARAQGHGSGHAASRRQVLARIARARRTAAIHFAWDGNRLLLEREARRQTLYLYEPDSFVPLALIRSTDQPPKTEEPSSLPLELRSLKDRYPEQWAAIELRRQKLLRKLGAAEEPPPPSPAVEIFHVHADHLGTPCELTDDDGHLVWSATYKAWGSIATIDTPARRVVVGAGNTLQERWQEQLEPLVQNLRFQGQYFDAETGLHYNRFRYYDPDIGRFLSQDPIGLAGGINTFQYAPNPTSWTDPFGLSCVPSLIRYKPRDELTAQAGSRQDAIDRAWSLEKDLLQTTGVGTRNWSPSEIATILNTPVGNKPGQLSSVMSGMGYTGHHINSVKNNGALGSKWQGDPRNIVFLENHKHPNSTNMPNAYNEHFHAPQGHRGSTNNVSQGRLIDRQAMIDASKRGCV